MGTKVNSDFVRNVAVSQPSGLGGVNRNAPNDVYGAAITGHQSPENSYLIDGPSVNNPACGVNGSPLTVVLIDEVSITAGGYMPEHGRSLDGALSATSTTPGTRGRRWLPHRGSEPGNLPLHQAVPRIEATSGGLRRRWNRRRGPQVLFSAGAVT